MIICVSHTTQRAGTRVHESVLIGAGAVVMMRICANSLYVSVPAKLVRCFN